MKLKNLVEFFLYFHIIFIGIYLMVYGSEKERLLDNEQNRRSFFWYMVMSFLFGSICGYILHG